MKSRRIHVGTSGWHYEHWVGPFYPEGTAPEDYLEFYSQKFQTAEINNTFYQVPKKGTLRLWRDGVPEDFIFSVKASRYITHMKKLKDPRGPVTKFLKRIDSLGEKLGPVLFQLPPRWKANLERLGSFLEALPSGFRYAFEFRDPSWFQERVYDVLSENAAAFCIYDFDRRQSPKEVTADFVYIRLHGPTAPYQGQYDDQTLAGWAGALSSWVRQDKRVYFYFDNDQSGYAVQDALRLKRMVGD